jgi:hypothetical protein
LVFASLSERVARPAWTLIQFQLSIRKRSVETGALREFTDFENLTAIKTLDVLRVVVFRYHLRPPVFARGIGVGIAEGTRRRIGHRNFLLDQAGL